VLLEAVAVIVLGLTATTWLQVKSKNFDPKADMPGVGFRIDATGAVFVQVQFIAGCISQHACIYALWCAAAKAINIGLCRVRIFLWLPSTPPTTLSSLSSRRGFVRTAGLRRT